MNKKLIFTTITILIISLGLTGLWLTGAASAGVPPTPPEGESPPLGSVPSSEMAPSQVHPVWTEFNISQVTGSLQTYPEIAANTDRGSYLTVWRDERDYKARIYGRIISAAGEVFTETLIYSQTSKSNLVPWTDVIYNEKAGDRYLVVWNGGDADHQYPDLYGQVVAFNGELISPTFRIDGGEESHYDFYPTLAHDPNNGPTLVVWSERWDIYFVSTGAQISGRFIDGAGNPLAEVFKINDLVDWGNLVIPAVAFNTTDNEYLVVWAETHTSAVNALYGQRVDWNGDLVGEVITISAIADIIPDALPDVAYDSANNEYLVVWHDKLGNEYNVYGQAIDADGALLGNCFLVSDATGNQKRPALDFRPMQNSGVYLVTWEHTGNGGGNPDLYGQWIIGGDPALIGDPVLLAGGDTLKQNYPALSYNDFTGQFLLAWHDDRDNDVYGKRLTGLPYDLLVSPLSLWSQPAVIRAGEVVTLGAHIFNRFGPALNGVDVDFYAGDPDAGGTPIGTQAVDFAQGQTSAIVNIPWDTTSLPTGTHTLFVVVDPDDEVPEMLETNNSTSRDRTIWPLVTDTQPPTGTLIINDDEQTTNYGGVNLIIDAHDDSPGGVRWMYLREWWLNTVGSYGEEAYVPGSGHLWDNWDTGWQPYDPAYATSGYDDTLNGTPGIKYIQAWFRDGAGNISEPPPTWDAINYVPSTAVTLGPGEWHLFRMNWTPGVSVVVTVTTQFQDADLYIWSPGVTGEPDLVSNDPGPAAHVDTVTFTAVAGVYQIVAYGHDPLGSQYTIEWQEGVVQASQNSAQTISTAVKVLPQAPPIASDAGPPEVSAIPEFGFSIYLPLVVR